MNDVEAEPITTATITTTTKRAVIIVLMILHPHTPTHPHIHTLIQSLCFPVSSLLYILSVNTDTQHDVHSTASQQ
jgi:hypothetical protein